jgi:F-type H+-transporting ATPase subunit alpha
MEASHPEIGRDITEKKQITDSTRPAMSKALDAFRRSWQA